MLKRIPILIAALFLCCQLSSLAQDERTFLLRQAKQRQTTTVGVDAQLAANNIMEVKVIAGMRATKPLIQNVILMGPKLGRLSPIETREIFPKAEEDESELMFPTEDMEGRHLRFSKAVQEKKIQGTLTRKFYRFKIPVEKIMRSKDYRLRVKVEGMRRSGERESFDFQLKNLADELLD